MHRSKHAEKVATAPKAGRIKRNIPLAPFTTLHIGGPAEMLIETHGATELAEAIASAHTDGVPVTILGEGSNVLISDTGINGLVITNRSNTIMISENGNAPAQVPIKHIIPRWQSDRTKGTFKYEFADLDYDESDTPSIEVEIDSGASLPKTINTLLSQGITGLQWFSGIPGTIGGAIINNIHGGTHFFHEYVDSVRVLTPDCVEKELTNKNLQGDYNKTELQKNRDCILSAKLHLHKGDAIRARNVASEWAKRKSIQPRNSPGCAFCNITVEEQQRLGYPTTSVGYIVEHVLNMTGFRVGDAAISTAHHNFIVNEGDATAKDYLSVMQEIIYRTQKVCGISLKPEIFLLGFGPEETSPLFPH